MDYEKKTAEELKQILDDVTKQRQQGRMSPSLYFSLVREISYALAKKGKGKDFDYNKAYERAMRGI